MRALSYDRIYKSQEYLASLGTIQYRSLFGSYSLTVEDTVFAMVANGELYLRACEESVPYCVKHPPARLMFMKCGRPLCSTITGWMKACGAISSSWYVYRSIRLTRQ